MTSSKKVFVLTLLVSLVFFIVGIVIFTKVLGLLEPSIEGITFVITGNRTALLFSLTLALIPVLTFATWRLAPIDSLFRKIFSISIISLTIVTALVARHQQVKTFFTRVVRPSLLTNGKTHLIYPIDPRNFVYYLFGGLMVGCAVSYLLLRQKTIK